MELSEFLSGERTITPKVNAKGATITITYDPEAVSIGELRTMTDREYVLRSVKAWSLTQNGRPVPVTPEGIDSLPQTFVIAVSRWIAGDTGQIPKEKLALSLDGSAPGQQTNDDANG